jgi:dynein light intermediate chain 1, cytosolic
MLVLDFEKPWLFLETVTKWMQVLKKEIEAVYAEDKSTGIDTENENAQVQWFQNYVEPAKEDGSGKPSFTDSSALAGGDDIVLPLGDGTLLKHHNLGVPIIIVCNKSDVMPALEKNFEYQDSDFEFIQQNLRTEALKYGATLLYTSTKNGKGIEILKDYVAHRLLATPFTTRAQVLDKDTLFVPSGYDTLDRITVLNDHTKTGSYEETIQAPAKKKVAARKEEEVKAQGDQDFLEAHKGNLEKAGKGERPVRLPMSAVELSTGDTSESPGPAAATATVTTPAVASPGGAPASSLTPGSSAMLQSFFESLMKSESNEGLRKDVEGVIAEEKKKGT